MFTLSHRQAFIFTLLLSVLLLTGCGGGGGGAGNGGSSTGIDTDGDRFVNSVDVDDDNNGLIEISSLEQLDWMRNDLAGASLTDNDGNIDTRGCPVDGCHGYELVADLDFDTNGDGVMDGNDTYYDNGSGWQPIGNKAHRFTADFNGNGHAIHNLYINRPTTNFNGLFSFVDGAGNTITLKDVILDGILMSVTGKDYTASLVGVVADAAIHNITINGDISGTTHTGGLLGSVSINVSIGKCTINGTINGVDNTGGLIGTTAAILSNPGYVNPSITDSQVNSVITGKTYTGVFVGREFQNVTITNSSATGQDDSDYDSDGIRNGDDVDDDDDGLIEISSLQQLDWMRNNLAGTSLNNGVDNDDNTGCPTPGCHGYELVADLDFDTNGDGMMDGNDTYYDNGSGWLPIGTNTSNPYTADFNGNGHTIHNLYINRPNASNNGLFGVVDGTNSANIIQDVQLVSTQVTGNVNTSSLVGLANNNSTISYCSASGVITGNASTGGLAGLIKNNSAISDSAASGSVTGNTSTGGLVGRVSLSATIRNSSASSAVTGGDDSGGLIGYLDNSTISDSAASGVVTGSGKDTGGLVGVVYGDSTIQYASASGAVTGNGDNTGGLVGLSSGLNGFVLARSTIINSTTSGAVTGKGVNTGGLVGFMYNLTIRNSAASGAVQGTHKTGGLVGNVNSSSSDPIAIIENSLATSSVTVTTGDYVGGLIGLSFQLTLKNSFATGEVTGVKYVGGLIGDANAGTSITYNFATGKVTGTSNLGTLVGWSDGAYYNANYFANDKGITNALGTNKSTPGDINPVGTTGAALAELQCPTTKDTTCNGILLYENWDTALWDFGSNMKLPGLIIGGTVYRDGDGKGVLD